MNWLKSRKVFSVIRNMRDYLVNTPLQKPCRRVMLLLDKGKSAWSNYNRYLVDVCVILIDGRCALVQRGCWDSDVRALSGELSKAG
jgi:hypothetical protein